MELFAASTAQLKGRRLLSLFASAWKMLCYPNCTKELLIACIPKLSAYSQQMLDRAIIEAKYFAMTAAQEKCLDILSSEERVEIPENLDYDSLSFLSIESKQRLNAARPKTLATLQALEGIDPSVVVGLYKYMQKKAPRSQ